MFPNLHNQTLRTSVPAKDKNRARKRSSPAPATCMLKAARPAAALDIGNRKDHVAVPRMTGAQCFAEMMQGYDVSHIFFVPAFMLKAFAEMEDRPIRRIMVHGEKAAAYMADGYARASGKPGVCMAQMIGASNLAAGLRDGFMAGATLIKSSTTSPSSTP